MLLKNFQEILASQLQNPDVRREFLLGYYEEEGVEGAIKALRHIQYALHGCKIAKDSSRKAVPRRMIRQGAAKTRLGDRNFGRLREQLNELGFDFGIVDKGASAPKTNV